MQVSSLQDRHGCEVLTAFVADKSLTALGSEVEGGDRAIHDRDLDWLREADGEQGGREVLFGLLIFINASRPPQL